MVAIAQDTGGAGVTALTTLWTFAGGLSGLARMAAAAAVTASLVLLWAFLDYGPEVREQTRLTVSAELEANFNKATEELSDDAEKARSRRLFCRASGRLYDFATGDCAEDEGGG